ncbi:6-phosphogluconolactonase [Robiginitomaculum antarcticum]|uniref:6-phosphogluconolactonase n=1 Tax=Robiginitomaculum antarcticum TaxID=437507 RepID=UPI00037EEBC7|nr:6-phosphogluconolactonase [Robiginitomaculum antarcticum]
MSDINANGARLLNLSSKDEAVSVASEIITAELDLAVAKRAKASFMVSGGSSPKPLYQALSKQDLLWEAIFVGLVDERWVKEGEPGSNATFIRETLLQNEAAGAHLLPMVTDHESAQIGAPIISRFYMELGQPFDVAVMGMGTDGHTASWFPASGDLAAALDKNAADLAMAVDATGCSGAGDFPSRMTLTRPAVVSTRNVILFIPGAAKRDVFMAALDKDEMDAPVRALLDSGARLTVLMCD